VDALLVSANGNEDPNIVIPFVGLEDATYSFPRAVKMLRRVRTAKRVFKLRMQNTSKKTQIPAKWRISSSELKGTVYVSVTSGNKVFYRKMWQLKGQAKILKLELLRIN